jgi:transcriptional regulator with PAS, ATPase and Fis domain
MARRTSARTADAYATTVRRSPPEGGGDLHLVVLRAERLQAHAVPPSGVLTVGRAPECDVVVEGATSLSRRHFVLRRGPPHRLHDLGSANGTKVNGRVLPAAGAVPIDSGSLVEAGGVFFIVHDGAVAGALPEEAAGRVPSDAALPGVVIEEPSMIELYGLVDMVARSTIPVLVVGETGVGKEVISDAIHRRSRRAQKPLVRLNCAALPESLLESELFGYERGAFTGATQAKQGLLEAAHEGTFFLDEVGELPLATQAKLLRVVENGELLRLGALKPRAVDIRFVAATNRDVAKLLEDGTFRRDLFYRLNGITIPVPPLRERKREIVPLARLCLTQAAARAGRGPPTFGREVESVLLAHSWPGNARELRHVMERALALCAGDEIRPSHVRIDAQPGATRSVAAGTASEARGRLLRLDPETEKRMIQRALDDSGGNQTRASELLGVSRRTLVNRLNEYGLTRPRK